MKEITKKGFTLIELLIVIAILAILAAAVTIVINPAELLAQARDGQRLSDMGTVNSALTTYLSQVSGTPVMDSAGFGVGGGCSFVNALATNTQPFNYASGSAGATASQPSSANLRLTTGVGWVDVNFSGLPGGSPLSSLPVDPVNSTYYTYCYVGNNTTVSPNYTFKLATRMESVKFGPKEIQFDASTGSATCGTNGSLANANTVASCWYQTGSNLGL